MTPKALAEAFGMTTADQLPPPQPRVADHGAIRARWTAARKLAFATLEPAALSLVATDGPVSVTLWDRGGQVIRLGHNRGLWPARLIKSAAWRDTATTAWDRNPFFFMGTQFRVWCESIEERDRLAESVLALIARRAEDEGGVLPKAGGQRAELLHGFADLGPDLDLELFELECHDIAKAMGLASFDDAGLIVWLDGVTARATAMAAAYGRRLSERGIVQVASETRKQGGPETRRQSRQ